MEQRLGYISEHFTLDTMANAIEALYFKAVASA
jgi:hypothetical protein